MVPRLFLLALFLVCPKEGRLKRPKYILDVERLEECTEPKYSNAESPLTNVKIYRVNETARVFGFEIQVERMWDEDVGISMELDVWAYTGWTRIPYMPLKPDFCNTIRSMFPGMLTEILQNMDITHPDKCPIEPGRYSLKNYTWDNSIAGNNFPFKGRFRLRSFLVSVRKKELISCVITILTAEENIMV